MISITWNHHERDRENCFADQLLLLFLHVEFNRLIPGNFSLSLFYLDRYELTAFLQEHRVTLSTTFSYVTHSYLQGFENLCYYSTTRSSIDRQHYCFLQRVNDRYEIFLIIRKFRFSINTVRRFKFRRAKNWIRIEKKKRYPSIARKWWFEFIWIDDANSMVAIFDSITTYLECITRQQVTGTISMPTQKRFNRPVVLVIAMLTRVPWGNFAWRHDGYTGVSLRKQQCPTFE